MLLYKNAKIKPSQQESLLNSNSELNNIPRKEQILVVDDTPANLKLVSDFLREAGFEIRVAKSGFQALKSLEKSLPDLILLDVMMPEMDGFETCQRLKDGDKTKDIPIIFMTAVAGSSDPTYKVRGLTLGAVDYISKPIQLEEVLARVKTHLNLRALAQQLQEQNRCLQEEIEVRQKTEEQLRLLERAIAASNNGIIISDPHQPDNPAIYANSGFERITGYKREEIIGNNCRFLTGTDTQQPALDELRRAIVEEKEAQVVLRNYRKDGTLFWNEFCLTPVRDATGHLTNFIGVQTDITEHKQREEALQLIVEGTAATTGEEFFRSCTRYLAQVLQVRYAFLAQCAKGSITKARTLVFWKGENFSENFEYELAGTPCEQVLLNSIAYYPEAVQECFGGDRDLVELGVQSYLGISLVDTAGNILGHLAVMDSSPMEQASGRRDILAERLYILKIFAARAAAELERQRAEEEIRFLLSTTQTIAEAEDFNSALSLMLRSCCEFINWDWGEVWVPNAEGTFLQYSANACIRNNPKSKIQNPKLSDPGLEEFRRHSLNLTFVPGRGLPGKIWSSKQPEWIEDVSVESSQLFPRNQIAAAVGIKAGFGVPVLVNDQVLAILVFFKKAEIPTQPHWLKLVQAVATQVASLIQRKQIEEQLKESEERWQLALKGNNDGIWDWNIKTNQTFRSPRFMEILGYEDHELGNSNDEWITRIHPDDFDRVMRTNQDYLNKKIPYYAVEHRLRCKDGSYKWVVSRGQAQWDEDGKPIRLVGSTRDIDERKRSEEEMHSAKVFLDSIVENIPHMIFLKDADQLRFVRFNKAGEDLLGYSRQDLIGKNDFDFFPPEQAEFFITKDRQVLAGDKVVDIPEELLQTKDKGSRILHTKKITIPDVVGKPQYLLGISEDITESKIAEEKLRRSEASLAEAQRVAHIGNWEFDVLTQKLSWSEELFHIFGLDPTKPEPTFAENLQRIHPDDRALWQRIVKKSLVTGKSYKFDFRIVQPSGQIRYIEGTGEAVVNEQGQVIKLFGTALDITERKQVEEALRRSEARERKKAQELKLALNELKRTQSQLIQAEKMSSLGRMVGGIAHEINNPVSFIYCNLIPLREYFQDLIHLIDLYQQTYPNSTSEIQNFVEEIDLDFLIEDWSKLINSMQVGAERIEQIVVSLKSFSRLDESKLKSVNIHEGIDNTLLILQNRLRAEGVSGAGRDSVLLPEIKVIKDYGQLPLVTCYASQLNQVFMNLLDNAIDAIASRCDNEALQSEPPLITITTSILTKKAPISNSQFAVIRITDNGIGMSEEVRQQIFDPFFTTKPVGSGTGLGLAISHQIVVEKHQGQITCVSAPGQGTELIVEIPVNLTAFA